MARTARFMLHWSATNGWQAMTTGRTFDWFDWTYKAQESSNIISQSVNTSTTLIIYCCLFFFSFVEIRKNYVLFEMKLENDLFRYSHHILRFSLAIVYLNTHIYILIPNVKGYTFYTSVFCLMSKQFGFSSNCFIDKDCMIYMSV